MQEENPHSVWWHAPDDLQLQPRQTDIWRVILDLPTDSTELLALSLSVDESRRAARFHFPADRDRFIIAHAGLRDILSRYLHCEPHQIDFSTRRYGKPALLSDTGINFNLSHSGGYALIAVASERKIGIDVERIRQEMELESLARRYFSQREVSELMALPPQQRTPAFFNCWTRKEAYIKAHGLGLSLPLDSFDVSLAPGEPVILRATRPNPQEALRWTLKHLEVDPGYSAALAVEGQDLEFGLWDWTLSEIR